jgi:hypothetical protein
MRRRVIVALLCGAVLGGGVGGAFGYGGTAGDAASQNHGQCKKIEQPGLQNKCS